MEWKELDLFWGAWKVEEVVWFPDSSGIPPELHVRSQGVPKVVYLTGVAGIWCKDWIEEGFPRYSRFEDHIIGLSLNCPRLR